MVEKRTGSVNPPQLNTHSLCPFLLFVQDAAPGIAVQTELGLRGNGAHKARQL